MNITDQKDLLESSQNEFLRAWAKADGGALTPSLPEIARRYPQVALELTEWATDFVALQAVVATNQDGQNKELEEATQRGIERAKVALHSHPSNLAEALSNFGLTPLDIAKKSRMAPLIISELCEGGLSDWPSDLPDVLASVLPVPVYRIPSLLANSAPTAQHYSASGNPTEQAHGTITFRQAVEDALEDGEFSPEDARFWLDKLDAEGK